MKWACSLKRRKWQCHRNFRIWDKTFMLHPEHPLVKLNTYDITERNEFLDGWMLNMVLLWFPRSLRLNMPSMSVTVPVFSPYAIMGTRYFSESVWNMFNTFECSTIFQILHNKLGGVFGTAFLSKPHSPTFWHLGIGAHLPAFLCAPKLRKKWKPKPSLPFPFQITS
jgi:hypothetical protein